jgi:hypothetical protein
MAPRQDSGTVQRSLRGTVRHRGERWDGCRIILRNATGTHVVLDRRGLSVAISISAVGDRAAINVERRNIVEIVASYRDYRRAADAVGHLMEHGFDQCEVCIEARGFVRRPVTPKVSATKRFGRACALAIPTAVGLFAVLALVPGVDLSGRAIAFVMTIAVAAAASGIAAMLLGTDIRHGLSRRRLVADTYDVAVTRDARLAMRQLAQWWENELELAAYTPDGEHVRVNGNAA